VAVVSERPIASLSVLIDRLDELLPPALAGLVHVELFNARGLLMLSHHGNERLSSELTAIVDAQIPRVLDGVSVTQVVWVRRKQGRR
jgi:hypothetical protein